MSSPSTPAASFARFAPSFASRAAAASSVFCARVAGTTTTPSSSATMTSPGVTKAPAHTTGMFTGPSGALTGPWVRARLEAARQQVAEIPVGAVGSHRSNDDVAGPDLLGHDVQHPVVAGM